ncbi:hypothetical protein ACFL96_06515 [Thermoproteota archaeon]
MDAEIKKVIGVLLIVLGVVGLFLPILQGTLLILVGAAVLKGGSIKENMRVLKSKIIKPGRKRPTPH